jgi:hypothetical protein
MGDVLFTRIETMWVCGERAGSGLPCGQVGECQMGDGW